MKNLVTNGFKNYKVPELILKADHIVKQMGVHASYFPTPYPTFTTVQSAIDELRTANDDAQDGSRSKELTRDEKKIELVSTLQLLGLYVNQRANGSRYIAELSGFDIVKLRQPQMLEMPGAPVAKLGIMRGLIHAQVPYQKAAKTCLWYYTTNLDLPLEQWTLITGDTAQTLIENCTPGVTYYIVIVMLGSKKQRVVSPITTIVA